MTKEAPRFFATPDAFRAWLATNHETATELLVGFWKRDSGKPCMTWPESVDEALCFGWIDGVRRSLGEESYTIRFTPRRPRSIWSAINVKKVATLIKAGKMMPAGHAAFAKLDPKRANVYSFEQRKGLKLEPPQEKALRANKVAWAFFSEQAPWYQRTCTHWIVSAKRPETRAKRLATLIADSAAGRTILPLTRPAGTKTTPKRPPSPKGTRRR